MYYLHQPITGLLTKSVNFFQDESHIEAKLISIGLNSSGLRDAYETLNGKSF